ncbi:redoxin domain-containing protein [Pseudoalteromonas sp. SG41-2]|uniref:redoxin family protein n=1 Tax=Pseudoalteromonas sp. SG41-2 TaxID=2760978 RepID=UPI0015FFC0D7|nr:redoxin family protein [Pseudoalteromonas sp. SG41-2]MBB1479341.1 redoxin domain-containing protein [Pseudoalteromonas sp. SG41-2]
MMKSKYIKLLWVFLYFSSSQHLLANESNLVLKNQQGELFELNKIVGKKPVYLKFWATWCKPCMEQMPHFQQAYEQYGDTIDTIAINIDLNDDPTAVAAVKKQFNLTMPIMSDHTAKVAQHYQFIGTPFHVLLDKTGKVIFQGHEADKALDNTLRLLSHDGMVAKAHLLDEGNKQAATALVIPEHGLKAILYTATWCDWYLADTRPKMATNCAAAQKQINLLTNQGIDTEARVSQLWTDQAAVDEYIEKFKVIHPVYIDHGNDLFIDNKISSVPTLVIYKNGLMVNRISDFSSPVNLQSK